MRDHNGLVPLAIPMGPSEFKFWNELMKKYLRKQYGQKR